MNTLSLRSKGRYHSGAHRSMAVVFKVGVFFISIIMRENPPPAEYQQVAGFRQN